MSPSVARLASRSGSWIRRPVIAAAVSRNKSATAVGPRTAVQNLLTAGSSGVCPGACRSNSRGATHDRGCAVGLMATVVPEAGAASIDMGGQSFRRKVPGTTVTMANRYQLTPVTRKTCERERERNAGEGLWSCVDADHQGDGAPAGYLPAGSGAVREHQPVFRGFERRGRGEHPVESDLAVLLQC